VGYSESEYSFSGTATSYANDGPLGSDGNWSVHPAAVAPYTSRAIVLAPKNPRAFSGHVVVEWLNVSGGGDIPPDWLFGHDDLIRNGDIYVGVSAQAAGVNHAKEVDPARYDSLTHPGDSFSYDIFSQAGMAVRNSSLLSGLRPRVVIAEGESQSAIRLSTYVNAVTPRVNVYDGFLIHSRSGGSAALSQAPQAVIPTPDIVRVRDAGVPVLTFESESDVAGPLVYWPARQPDSRNFRLWEVAGTSHGDNYALKQALDDDGGWASDLQQFASLTYPASSVTLGPLTATCTVPFNGGQEHYVFQTAQRDLIKWAKSGIAPPSMPRLSVDTSTTPATYRRDTHGNVLGGVRSPAVDAPISTLSGLPPADGPGFCRLFGQTHPFTPSQLAELYPTRHAFERAWRAAVRENLQRGSLLPQDAKKLLNVV
jgi:hypothetical protein